MNNFGGSDKADGEPVYKNGMIRRDYVSIYKMRDMSTGSAKFVRYGEALLRDDTPVQGLLPYGALCLKFSYNLGKEKGGGHGGLQCHKIYGYPKLDYSGVRLPLKCLDYATRRVEAPSNPQPLDKYKPVYLSPLIFFHSKAALSALSKYDHDNTTSVANTINWHVANWSKQFTRASDKPTDTDSILYAQFAQVFETLFGIGFYDLQHLRFEDIARACVQMNNDGPHRLLTPFSAPDRMKVKKDKGRPTPPPRGPSNKPVVTEGLIDEEDDEEGKSGSTKKFEDSSITLELTLKRALSIYQSQIVSSTGKRKAPDTSSDGDDGDDDDEDEDTNDAPGVEFGDFLDVDADADADAAPRASAKNPAGPLKLKSGAGSNRLDVALADGTVVVSTNPRKVRLPLPDMRRIPEDAWVAKLLMTHLESRYHGRMDMCISQASILDMIGDGMGMNLPADLSLVNVWRVMKEMVCAGKIAMFDSDTCTVYRTAKCKDALDDLVTMPETVYVALPNALKHEHETFEWLKRHIERRYDDTEHMRAMGEQLSKLDTLFNPNGRIARLRLSDEQWRAVCLSVTSPLSLISGPGGTGKTTLIQIIVRILRCAGLTGKILFTAFKNDTVNQTQHAIRSLDVKEAVHHRLWSAYKRENDIFATCDSVAYRWGLLRPEGSGQDASGRSNSNAAGRSNNDPESFSGAWTPGGMRAPGQGQRQGQAKAQAPDYRLDAEVVLFEEASLLSMAHLYHVMKALNPRTLKYVLMIGDDMQLPPLKPGFPFANLIVGIPQLAVRLVKGFRTSSEVITANLNAARKCDIDAMCFHDPSNPDDKDGSCFIHMEAFGRIAGKHRAQKVVLQTFGAQIEKLLQARDPDRTRYKSMWAISAYNDVARYASYIYAGYYFGDATPDEKRIEYAYGDKKIKPILHVDERVVFLRTDKVLGHARGRVGYVTAIFDHKHESSPAVDAHATTTVQSTAAPLHTHMTHRSIVVDRHTVVTSRGAFGFGGILEPAGCITIHRSQGAEYDEVLCLFAPGVNLCNNRVFYTALSRTKEKCHILGSPDHIQKMITTPAPVPHCAFLPMLRRKLQHDRIGVFDTLASEFARTSVTMLHPHNVNVFESEYDHDVFTQVHHSIAKRAEPAEKKAALGTQVSSS